MYVTTLTARVERDALHDPVFDEPHTFAPRRGWVMEC